ncbi:hypothetical protein J3R83DRAFT_4180 [Lanmaoa asiatica]|nr:hypothetical protein J3R83DRAFT_4180 [Lanmaoa asiatica]
MPQTQAQAYLVCTWLEAILYGINCMLFGFCIQVLTSNTKSSRRVFAAAIVQFSLSTAHVIIVLVELLQAFTHEVDPNVYYSNPGASNASVAALYVYVVNTFAQELLLIWRLHGLWGGKFRVSIVPLILWVGHLGTGIIAVISFIPTTATGGNLRTFVLTGWGLETATNLTANFGIAYRLWKAERRTAPLGAQRRLNYQSTMLLIVECGALITTCTVIMFGLYSSGHESGLAIVGIAAQIATVSPLLIVVRMGLAQAQSRSGGRTMLRTHPLEISVLRTEDTFIEDTSKGTGKHPSNSSREGV